MTSKVGAPSLDDTLDNPMQIRMIMAICRSRTVLIKIQFRNSRKQR